MCNIHCEVGTPNFFFLFRKKMNHYLLRVDQKASAQYHLPPLVKKKRKLWERETKFHELCLLVSQYSSFLRKQFSFTFIFYPCVCVFFFIRDHTDSNFKVKRLFKFTALAHYRSSNREICSKDLRERSPKREILLGCFDRRKCCN